MIRNSPTVIVINCDLDSHSVPRIRQQIDAASIAPDGEVIIDLLQVQRITTAGVALLVTIRQRTNSEVVLANLSIQGRAMLNMYKLQDQIFDFADACEPPTAALSSCP